MGAVSARAGVGDGRDGTKEKGLCSFPVESRPPSGPGAQLWAVWPTREAWNRGSTEDPRYRPSIIFLGGVPVPP